MYTISYSTDHKQLKFSCEYSKKLASTRNKHVGARMMLTNGSRALAHTHMPAYNATIVQSISAAYCVDFQGK